MNYNVVIYNVPNVNKITKKKIKKNQIYVKIQIKMFQYIVAQVEEC